MPSQYPSPTVITVLLEAIWGSVFMYSDMRRTQIDPELNPLLARLFFKFSISCGSTAGVMICASCNGMPLP